MLPILDYGHHRFSTIFTGHTRTWMGPFTWYVNFLKVIRQSHYHDRTFRRDVFLRLLGAIMLVLLIISLSVLIDVSNTLPCPAQTHSALFALLLLTVSSFIPLIFAFSLHSPLASLGALDDFFLRQLVLILLLLCGIALPGFATNSIHTLSLLQEQKAYSVLPTFGFVLAPVSACLSLIALTLMARNWLAEQSSHRHTLVPTIQSECVGTLALTLQSALSLEQLVLSAFFVAVYAGGTYLPHLPSTPWIGFLVFGLKLIVVSLLIGILGRFFPRWSTQQTFSFLLFSCLPLSLLNYFVLAGYI